MTIILKEESFVFFDEGGKGQYKISPKKKKTKEVLLVFPSNFCFPHAITPRVLNGDRHAIITWIH